MTAVANAAARTIADSATGPGETPDVAIWAIPNPRSAITLRRVAEACLARRLRTVVLWSEWEGRGGGTPASYPIPGIEFLRVPFRLRFGPLRYSNPLTLPLLAPAALRVLRKLQPRCLLTQLDHAMLDRVWQYSARRLGLPGAVLQEGMANVPKGSVGSGSPRRNRNWSWTAGLGIHRWVGLVPHPLLRTYAPYMFAEHVCVWGEAMQRHLLALGRSPSSIAVTGSPAFDNVNERAPLRHEVPSTVLYAQQRMGLPLEKRLPFYRQVLETVALDLGCQMLFKLHPNSFSEVHLVRALTAEMGLNGSQVEIISEGDSVDLLPRCGVLLTASSTTAYHALIAGVPVVLADYVSPDIRFDLGEAGGAIVVREPRDLRAALGAALFDSVARERLYAEGERVIREHLFRLDGMASDRVAGVLARLGSRTDSA